MNANEKKLTKADTVALWHAVAWMELCLRQSNGIEGAALAAERARLTTAKRALRKVNALRKDLATMQADVTTVRGLGEV